MGALLQSPEFVEALKKDREFMQSLAEETQRKSVPKGFNETIDDEATTEMLKERIAKMGKGSTTQKKNHENVLKKCFWMISFAKEIDEGGSRIPTR